MPLNENQVKAAMNWSRTIKYLVELCLACRKADLLLLKMEYKRERLRTFNHVKYKACFDLNIILKLRKRKIIWQNKNVVM